MDIKMISKQAKEALAAIHSKEDHVRELTFKDSKSIKLAKDECASLCKSVGLVYKEGFEDRVVRFRFTNETADRHNEVIIASGVKLDSFKEDPIILSQHNSRSFPIGRSIRTEYRSGKEDVIGDILFFDDEVDRTGLSETTFRMVKAGAMKNGSIGFRAKSSNVRMANPEEKKKYKLDDYGLIFDEIELREFSVVTIPANPDATQIGSRKEYMTEAAIDTIKKESLLNEECLKHLIEVKDDQPDPYVIAEGTGNVTINISKNDTVDMIRSKLAQAKKIKADGFNVDINMYKEEEEAKEEVITISKEDKELVTKALSFVVTLQKGLNVMLGSKVDVEEEEEPESKDVHNGSSTDKGGGYEDSNISSLFDDLEKATNKIKKL